MGHKVTDSSVIKIRGVWEDFGGAFNKDYHWERKGVLNAIHFENPRVYVSLGYVYERLFGPEFFRGESMLHPENLGLNLNAQVIQGWRKDWKVSKLTRPSITWEMDSLRERPYGKAPKKSEARKFNTLRRRTYRESKPFPTWVRDFTIPRIEMNNKYRPSMTAYERSVPRWADIRMLFMTGTCTGKIVYGLSPDETILAPERQKFALDPFEARATGGYEILTRDYAIRGPSEEDVYVAEEVNRSRETIAGHLTWKKEVFGLSKERQLLRSFDADIPHEDQGGQSSTKNPYTALLAHARQEALDHAEATGYIDRFDHENIDEFLDQEDVDAPQYAYELLEEFVPELLYDGPVSPRGSIGPDLPDTLEDFFISIQEGGGVVFEDDDDLY